MTWNASSAYWRWVLLKLQPGRAHRRRGKLFLPSLGEKRLHELASIDPLDATYRIFTQIIHKFAFTVSFFPLILKQRLFNLFLIQEFHFLTCNRIILFNCHHQKGTF